LLPAVFKLIAVGALVANSAATQYNAGSAPAERPIAQDIINRAAARAEAQYRSLAEAGYESNVTFRVHSLDENQKILKTELTLHRQYPVQGAVFEELVGKNGRPLNSKEIRAEEERKQDFIREVKKRTARGEHPQPERGPGIRFNQQFVSRYNLTVVGTETIRGYRCWIIAFEPKPGKLPVRDRMDHALNQSNGKFWVSQDDYGLARIEFFLRKPFEYWGGFLAVIRNTEGRVDYVRVDPGIWLTSDFDLKLDLRVMMVKDIRRHLTKQWSDYRRFVALGPTGGGSRSPIRPSLRNLSAWPILGDPLPEQLYIASDTGFF
jgi:hypothetical protein